jgi:Putative ATPase subunit of terminase (gpP-like)
VELRGCLSRPCARQKIDITLRLLGSIQPVFRPASQVVRRPFRLEVRLTPGEREEIVAAYQAGAPSTALATTYGLGKGSVLRLLRNAGVAMRNQGLSEADINVAVALYAAGWSLARIAEQYGVNDMTVRAALLKRAVTMWPPNVRR